MDLRCFPSLTTLACRSRALLPLYCEVQSIRIHILKSIHFKFSAMEIVKVIGSFSAKDLNNWTKLLPNYIDQQSF